MTPGSEHFTLTTRNGPALTIGGSGLDMRRSIWLKLTSYIQTLSKFLKIGIDPTANKITTQFTPSAKDNVQDWLKPILQFFENIIGILTVGFVSPGDHVLSGINEQDKILSDMGKYAVGLINSHLQGVSSGPATTDKQLDYLNHLVHTNVNFAKPSPKSARRGGSTFWIA